MSRRSQQLRHGFLLPHRWGGLVAGLVLLVVAVTGTLLVFEQDLDRALHAELWRVDAARASLPLAEVTAAAAQAHPDRELRQLILRAGAGQPVEVRFEGGRHAIVDPGTGALLGTVHRPYSFFGIIERLHTDLCAGAVGKWIVAISALTLVGLLVSGLWLWWPKQWRQLKGAVSLALGRKGRALHFNLHNTLGFWSALPLVVIAATGAIMAIKPLGDAVRAIGGGSARVAPPVAVSDISLPRASPDAAFAAAQRVFPEWSQLRLHFPRPRTPKSQGAMPGAAMGQDHDHGPDHEAWRAEIVAADAAHEHARSRAWFDPRTAELLRVDRFEELPLGARMRALARPVHDGSIFGRPTQVVALLSVLMVPVLTITGVALWWLRTRAQRARASCAARGLIRQPATLKAAVATRFVRRAPEPVEVA